MSTQPPKIYTAYRYLKAWFLRVNLEHPNEPHVLNHLKKLDNEIFITLVEKKQETTVASLRRALKLIQEGKKSYNPFVGTYMPKNSRHVNRPCGMVAHYRLRSPHEKVKYYAVVKTHIYGPYQHKSTAERLATLPRISRTFCICCQPPVRFGGSES